LLIIQIFKDFENLNKDSFVMSQSSLHGYLLKLNKQKVTLDVVKFPFIDMIVNEWNILNEEIIVGNSLFGLKKCAILKISEISILPLICQ